MAEYILKDTKYLESGSEFSLFNKFEDDILYFSFRLDGQEVSEVTLNG